MRQGNRLVTNSVVQATRQTTNEFLRELAADPDLSKLYFAGLAGREALPNEDRLRFDMVLLQVFRLHESLFLERQDGHLTEEVFGCYERAVSPLLKQSGGLASWQRQRALLTERFTDYVDQTLVDPLVAES